VRKPVVCLLLLVAACHDHEPPAPTAEQSDQLNNAEDMLNGMTTNEEGPTDRSAGPSNRSD